MPRPRETRPKPSAGLMQLEAEQRGEMASTFQRRTTEAYPEGMATGESL